MHAASEVLIELARQIGREDRNLAILGEGNVSAKVSDREFLVKASGTSLGTLKSSDLTSCNSLAVLKMLDRKTISDSEVEDELLQARLDSTAKKPSTETVFHAWLLSLENVRFVGHCHPTAANQVLCSPRARDFAERRLFPDEVVCCGAASVFVPYIDPGIPLAREIRERTTQFIKSQGYVPRLILLQNHGIISLGNSPESVLGCILMATKAAEIFTGAAALGGPNFMSKKDVDRIAGRPDEAYRQRQLGIV